MHIRIERQKHVFGALLIAVGQKMIIHNLTAYQVMDGGNMSPHASELIKSMMENGCDRQEAEEALSCHLDYILD